MSTSESKDEKVESVMTSRLAKLNPFREKEDEGGDEEGEEVDENTVAGGGRGIGGVHDIEARKSLRVSHALRSFLASQGEIKEEDVGKGDDDKQLSPAMHAILERPQLKQPDYVKDRNFGLAEYYISSSHNTYLVGNQLTGDADAGAYKRHLQAGARCVEIDAWDSDDKQEPKVTHGFTLTQHVSFRNVCKAINDVMDEEIKAAGQGELPLPIFISLENHCSPQCQMRLAAIMHEEFGDKLVSKHVHEDGSEVKLKSLVGRIMVMVEYYGETTKAGVEEDASKETHSRAEEAAKATAVEKAEEKPVKIIPELSELGVYAQSMKPHNDSWTRDELNDPGNHLANVEERAVKSAIADGHSKGVSSHNAKHLMRIYPKGTRVGSENLKPVPFWGIGAQVTALNWQTFDASMQLNEALFAETDGWVLKPPHLRSNPGPKVSGKTELTLEIAGATDLAVPKGRDSDIKPYVTCTLYHPTNLEKPVKEKTSAYRQHMHKKLIGQNQPPPTSPIWNPPEKLTWTYDEDELVFLRLLVKSDDSFSRNPAFLCSAIRLCSAPQGWHFIRMLDLKGAETRSTLLVRFTKKTT